MNEKKGKEFHFKVVQDMSQSHFYFDCDQIPFQLYGTIFSIFFPILFSFPVERRAHREKETEGKEKLFYVQ